MFFREIVLTSMFDRLALSNGTPTRTILSELKNILINCKPLRLLRELVTSFVLSNYRADAIIARLILGAYKSSRISIRSSTKLRI